MSLSSRSQRLLQSARREVQPTPEDLRRVRARLASSVSSGFAHGSNAPFIPLVLFAVAAATALGLASWHVLTRPAVDPPAARSSATPASGPGLLRESRCPSPPECPAIPTCPAAPPAKVPRCAPSEPQRAGPVPTAGEGLRSLTFAVPSDPSARLELEVSLLTEARVALDDGRSLDAIGHVNRHKELFPNSTFEEERLAIEVVAKCQVSRPELAQEPFRRLIERDPRTTYLARIRDACGQQFDQPDAESDDE